MPKGRSNGGEPPELPTETKPGSWCLRGAHGATTIPACGLVVGRSRLCDLVLPDSDISRRHLRLSLVQDEPWAIDLGSASGLLIDGVSTARARLHDGSTLWLGNTCLELRRQSGSLPLYLLEAWSRLGASPAEALRDLAGAISCTLEPDRSYALQWEAGAGWDDLGPLRRALVNAAVEWIFPGKGVVAN